MTRTFCDAGVLIAAARAFDPDGEPALQLLEAPGRIFLTSPFIRLVVLPKAIFYKKRFERLFYERYFDSAASYDDVAGIEQVAQAEAAKVGLGAMDALHVATAYLSSADEFITTEKSMRAIHRSKLVRIISLFG